MKLLGRWLCFALLLCVLGGGTCNDDNGSSSVVLTVPPTNFNLLSPADKTGASVTATLTWENPTGETSFRLEIASDQNFTNIVHYTQLNTDTTSYTVPQGSLSANRTYYWRVYAENVAGQVLAQNAPWSFITVGPNTAVGTLDISFAGTGYVVVDNPTGNASTPGEERGNGVVIDSQDRIIVVGSTYNGTDTDMIVWRYNKDGTLDTTNFASGKGYVTSGMRDNDVAYAVDVDGNDNIYICGYSGQTTNSTVRYFTLWKVDNQGSLVNFGNNSTPVIWQSNSEGFALYVDRTNSKIYVVGYITVLINNASVNRMTVWRFDANTGTLDTTFGTGNPQQGYYSFPSSGHSVGYAFQLDSNNRVVVAGLAPDTVNTNPVNNVVSVWRVLADGTGLDTTFGTNGQVVEAGAEGAGYGMGIDPNNNNIWVCGYRSSSSAKEMAVWRFTSAGALDTSFTSSSTSTQGYVMYSLNSGDDIGNSMLIDLDGKVVIVGYTDTGTQGRDMVIWRLVTDASKTQSTTDKDGDLDKDIFNNPNGYVTHNSAAGGSGNDQANAVAIHPGTSTNAGRLVVVGFSVNSSNNLDMVMWRWR